MVPSAWRTPVVDMVLLPAHAQLTEAMCEPSLTLGGPLEGNPYLAESCPAACEAAADSVNGELCSTTETSPTSGIECSCDISGPAG